MMARLLAATAFPFPLLCCFAGAGEGCRKPRRSEVSDPEDVHGVRCMLCWRNLPVKIDPTLNDKTRLMQNDSRQKAEDLSHTKARS